MDIEKERETYVRKAKAAQQVKRHREMVEFMNKVAKLKVKLTLEERELLLEGYWNVVEARRTAWRVMTSIQRKEMSEKNAKLIENKERNLILMKNFRYKVKEELCKIFNEIVTVIDEHLVPLSSTGESIVVGYITKGDYYRYMAEFKTGDEKLEVLYEALRAYRAAEKTAATDLVPTRPLTLRASALVC